MKLSTSRYFILVQQILVGLLLVSLGLLVTRGMVRQGSLNNMQTVAAALLAMILVLLLDRRYWILCPLGFVADPLLPAIMKLSASELGCLAVIITGFFRQALRRESNIRFKHLLLYAAPYFIWVGVIFILNSTGFSFLGGRTIGARFYFKILLAFLAMLSMSTQEINEDDCRYLFYASVGLGLAVLVRSLYRFSQVEETDSAVSVYSLLPAAALFYWIIVRYRFSKLLRFGWQTFAALLLLLATFYTGKRRVTFNVAIFPLLRAFVSKQDRKPILLAYLLASIPLTLMLAGQGRVFSLPLSMQRGLSFLPAKWDSQIAIYAGGEDPFRDNVRSYAWQQVRDNPWMGRQGFAIDYEEVYWINYAGTTHDFEGHALVGNWHNTWIGMMADFGIPGALGWAVFVAALFYLTYSRLNQLPPGSYRYTVVLYHCCSVILMVLASHTSGHSALMPFQWWPIFGLVLAIRTDSNELQSVELKNEAQHQTDLRSAGRDRWHKNPRRATLAQGDRYVQSRYRSLAQGGRADD